MSGLGGDSSDAAAVLRGLNQLWELGLSQNKLLEMAQELGSDVSFFFSGGTALMEGRGEKITPLPPMPHQWVILIIPNVPRLPGQDEAALQHAPTFSLHRWENYRETGSRFEIRQRIYTSSLFNTFENVVFTRGEELTNYRDHILKIGAPNVHLAGSGPTLFTLLEDKSQAEDLLSGLKIRAWKHI